MEEPQSNPHQNFPKKNNLKNKIEAYSLRLLLKRPYTKHKLEEKLKTKYPDNKEEIQEILIELENLKYLNDSEFALNYLEYRQKTSPRSIQLMRYELMKKGISKENIDSALSKLEIEDDVLCSQALDKKLKISNKTLSHKDKEKIYRFLQSRGFDWSSISKSMPIQNDNN